MNWRRGFFRLWLIGTAAWAVLVTLFMWRGVGEVPGTVLALNLLVVVIPSVAALLLGSGLAWAAGGLRR